MPEKNGNDVFQVSTFLNPVSVMSTIGDISPKLDHVIVTIGEISPNNINNGLIKSVARQNEISPIVEMTFKRFELSL